MVWQGHPYTIEVYVDYNSVLSTISITSNEIDVDLMVFAIKLGQKISYCHSANGNSF